MVSDELPEAAGLPPGAAGLAAGSRVAGYLLEEQVGAGGMAVVFRARDVRLRRPGGAEDLGRAGGDEDFRRAVHRGVAGGRGGR